MSVCKWVEGRSSWLFVLDAWNNSQSEDHYWFMLISHMAVCLFFRQFRAVLLIPKHSSRASRKPNCLSYLLYAETKYSGSKIIDLAYIMAVARLCSNPLFGSDLPTFHWSWHSHVLQHTKPVSDWKSWGFHWVMSAWVRATPRMWCVSMLRQYLTPVYTHLSDCGQA